MTYSFGNAGLLPSWCWNWSMVYFSCSLEDKTLRTSWRRNDGWKGGVAGAHFQCKLDLTSIDWLPKIRLSIITISVHYTAQSTINAHLVRCTRYYLAVIRQRERERARRERERVSLLFAPLSTLAQFWNLVRLYINSMHMNEPCIFTVRWLAEINHMI